MRTFPFPESFWDSQKERMFEIHVEDRKVETGMVPVSWCVSRELLRRLAELKIRDPHVLLVTAPTGGRYHPSNETRKLVPLTDGMAYVEFRADGPNQVFAVLVFWFSGINRVHDYFFARENGSWKTSVLTTDGRAFASRMNKEYVPGNTSSGWGIVELPSGQWPDESHDETEGWRGVTSSLEVIGTAGVFAKPPPAWETAWVNHWFRQAPIDECDYRKRRLWAYSVQPPVMLLNWLFRLVVTVVALLAGFRQVNWQPVFRLLSTNAEDALGSYTNGNYFWPKSWGNSMVGLLARCALPFFTPLSLLAIGALSALLAGETPFATIFLKFLLGFALGFPAIVGIALAIVLAFAGIGMLTQKAAERKAEHVDYLEPETIDYLSCDAQGGTRRTIGNVPWRRRSVRLIFEATKAQVCRPFAR